MRRVSVLAIVVMLGCGGDGEAIAPCTLTASGDVTGTSQCRMFLCYPRGDTYQALLLSQLDMPGFEHSINIEVDAPTTFMAGQTYSLAQLRMQSEVYVMANGKTYKARAQATAPDPAEAAQLAVTRVTAPGSDDPCSGIIKGTLSASLVEIMTSGSTETVGSGRVNVQVALDQ
jgi:hypothetical protein